MSVARRVVVLTVALVSSWVLTSRADSWLPPSTETYVSAKGTSRAIIVPRALAGALPFFKDKVDGVEPAGQAKGAPARSPMARVERKQADGSWKLLWVRPLINDVGPSEALVANDASFLVTFDNWHSVGYGDDVVVIYDGRGQLVRKLSLEQILPANYARHLPRSVSSRWWGGEHRLTDGDKNVELQIVVPATEHPRERRYVPLKIRLTDGAVLPATGKSWEAAVARADAMEAERVLAWNELRKRRVQPLPAPTSRDTGPWNNYIFEIRNRITEPDERMAGFVLPAMGQRETYPTAETIASDIELWDSKEEFHLHAAIYASSTPGAIAEVLAKSLAKREPGSMKGFHLVLVGSESDRARVEPQAVRVGARFTWVDVARPFPPGKPLPSAPPEGWFSWAR